MSVRRTDYVIVGVKFGYGEFRNLFAPERKYESFCEKYGDNSYEKPVIEHNGLTLIYDSMGSKYSFLGKVIAKEGDNIGCNGLPVVDCNVKAEVIEEVREKIVEVLGLEIENIYVSVYAFTNWS